MKYLAIFIIFILLISFCFAANQSVVSHTKSFNAKIILDSEKMVKEMKAAQEKEAPLVGEILIVYREVDTPKDTYLTNNYINPQIDSPTNTTPSNSNSVTGASSLEEQIHHLINAQRNNYGLQSLVWDEALSKIARKHSADMASKNYFSHTSPNGNTFSDRYAKSNYFCQIPATNGYTYYGGENIFQTNTVNSVTYIGNQATYNKNSEDDIAIQTVQGWMNSSGHRNNILSKLWEKEGIGVSIANNGKVYITQNFC